MPHPYRHPKTGVWWYRERVPADLRALAKGQSVTLMIAGRVARHKIGAELKVSLATKDAGEAKLRHAEVAPQFDAIWAGLREGPKALSFKNMRALAGEVYRDMVGKFDANPGSPEAWEVAAKFAQAAPMMAERDPEAFIRLMEAQQKAMGLPPLAEGVSPLAPVLAKNEIVSLSDSDQLRLGEEVLKAQAEGAARLAQNARGDYSPDLRQAQFPSYEAQPKSDKLSKGLSLLDLLEHKEKTRTLRPKTVVDYRRLLKAFSAFVGHDDALRLTKADVRRWRDKLIADGSPKKTINDRYLASIKSVLNHGLKEFDLQSNVAAGIRDERNDVAPAGGKDYTMEEAKAILSATFRGTSKDVEVPYQRAAFWVPWLCAYTGARVTEITQIKAERLLWDGNVPYLLITPEDGSTKNNAAWLLGIHRHLIELGLLKMIEAVGSGPLFYAPYPEGTDLTRLTRHRSSDSAKRVTDWINEVLGTGAPLGRPNHAWRHTFTTLSRVGEMDKEARDFMMGSRSTTDAREGYGEWPPVVLDREINKLPRLEVEETDWRPSTAKAAVKNLRAPSAPKVLKVRRRGNNKTEAGNRR